MLLFFFKLLSITTNFLHLTDIHLDRSYLPGAANKYFKTYCDFQNFPLKCSIDDLNKNINEILTIY